MSDGSIGGGKYCRRCPLSPSSIIDDVFDCGGAPSWSDHGDCCRGLVISLFPSSLRGGAPFHPGSDDNKDDDDRSRQDRATGLRNGNVGAPLGDVINHNDELWRRLQVGLRQQR